MKRITLLLITLATLLSAAPARACGGWYLMYPPIVYAHAKGTQLKVDQSAPYSQWQVFEAFDKADDCESSGHFYVENVFIAEQSHPEMLEARKDWICLGTDDPRLKP